MSNTRHAAESGPLAQERYMSSYAELRGLNGGAVAAKAQIVLSHRARSLLFFLQARSLEDGGLARVAEEILAMFPERIGSAAMRKLGMKPGKIYSSEEADAIAEELGLGEFYSCSFVGIRPSKERSVEHFRTHFIRPPALAKFLAELCVNPALSVCDPEATEHDRNSERLACACHFDDTTSDAMHSARAPGFIDIIGALFDYQHRCTARAETQYAKTTAARKIWSTLKDGLRARKMVLIEAESDTGKSTAAKAFCRAHLGETRYVSLQGITSRTAFFRAIARTLGIATSHAYSTTEVQSRVVDMLQRSKLQLVLDESQYLFAQSERVYSRPELVDWIYTALCNHDVPVGLLASPLFSRRMAQAAKQVTWNFTQFERRIFRRPEIPLKPTRNDIELVARFQLPDGDANTIKYLCGQAQESHTPFTMLVNTITDAKLIAEDAGRNAITLADLKRSVDEFRVPTELQNRRAHEAARAPGRRSQISALKGPLREPEEGFEAKSGGDTFTGRSPVAALQTHPANSGRTPALENA